MTINWVSIRSEMLSGKPVLVFDSFSREAAVDMVFYAEVIEPTKIRYLRKNAGGIIEFVSGKLFKELLDLPFMHELFNKTSNKYIRTISSKKPKYGEPPAITIWVNHIDTKTGISDRDRAITIKNLFEVARLIYRGYVNTAREKFSKEFYMPGYVPILTSQGLAYRQGHTELVTALALITGLIPAMVISEMLSEDGESLSYEDAKRYARRQDLSFIEGSDIVVEAEKRGLLND
ncbi:MAG: 3,4-dihydroxy-2-butanone-4-phosphate synthase [Thermoprotei archaeon]